MGVKAPRRYLPLTDEQKTIITAHFFGPFDPSWYDDNGILDNEDKVIAARVGAELSQVRTFTIRLITDHFDNLNKIHERAVY